MLSRLPRSASNALVGAAAHLPEVLALKYGPRSRWGWSPALRQRFAYTSPDDWYEATLFRLIGSDTLWLDVGCGRHMFPSNPAAAKLLAARSKCLVGIDPSDNIHDNMLVHEKAKCFLEEYETDRRFELITMRMVAEHVAQPAKMADALARLIQPGGRVVIYTVQKWSPVSIIAALTPLRTHVWAKRYFWGTAARDSFPTAYKINTRASLTRYLAPAGFTEESFDQLDDCRAFAQIPALAWLELAAWRLIRAFGLSYPERCILAIYRKSAA